ncbi:adenylate/guanylate cyclase domain-containing protein [Roseimicrobium sp. ORNL1]|uniref:adenylate/guanylate cyclase domain-containing protein n=1 Tax=Roseimicrobium sp. ORNL1 TaxID=2711231 RepID=UPI0013E18A75|nr:adenylate/guanylate cyclase domain-containing protein [Roseimicrobium sp. ORNL1]QIF00916.1 CHASE2 domain-containing protein [Roseimicrobium sp. ORNL1]
MTNNRLKNLLSSESAVRQRMLAMLILGSFGVLALLYGLKDTRPLMDARDRLVLDEFHASSRKTPARDDIVILGIDDASQKLDTLWPEEIDASPALKEMKKQWQWRRRVWAPVLDRLFEAGAKYVFLDLTFKAPAHDEEDDRLLREALERHKGKVVIGGKYEIESAAGTKGIAESTEIVPLTEPSSTVVGEDFRTSDMYGILNFFGDAKIDGVVRSADYWVSVNQLIEQGTIEAQKDPTEVPRPSIAMVLGRKVNPEAAAKAGTLERLRFCDPGAYPPLSIHQLFVDDFWKNNFGEGAVFKDKIVMVGATASDLQDFQDTTLGRFEGVRIHAHALTALLAGSFVHDAPWWWPWASLTLGTALAWSLVSLVRHPLATIGILVLVIVGAYAGTYWLFDRHNLEASPVPFVLALGLCGVMGLAGNYLMQRRAQQYALRLLARYTSPEMAKEMVRDRHNLFNMLGGMDRTVTVLFSDLRGFTSMSEAMQPSEVVAQLNEYLSKMVERVFKQRGLVDKFIGDAVMALWFRIRGAQDESTAREDARRAVQSALEMRKSLEELNAERRKRDLKDLKFGIGIHQGQAVVGNIGSEFPYEKMDITVIGDSVNTASRLESASKQYGVDLLISDAVRQHLGDDYICRTADLVRPPGKLVPVAVYTIIGTSEDSKPPGLDDFESAIVLYREGKFPEAKEALLRAEEAGLGDQLTYEYIHRCDRLLAEPPHEWDGVYVLTKK